MTALFALRPISVAILTLGDRTAVTRSGTRALRALARTMGPLVGLRVTVVGAPPPGPCVVAPNHVTYLDVFVLAAAYDSVFVSRADVRGWPGLGPLARLGGTIWIDRERKRDAARAGDDVGTALDERFRVTVFLEGGTGDGTTILPFRPSLLEPACARGTPCVAARVVYGIEGEPEASVARDVVWGDETPFGAHAMRLLGLERITARVVFGPVRVSADRKALAAELHGDCASLS